MARNGTTDRAGRAATPLAAIAFAFALLAAAAALLPQIF